MSIGVHFKKTIDDLSIYAFSDSTWVTIQARRGGSIIQLELRSTEEVRDLQYALERYLQALGEKP